MQIPQLDLVPAPGYTPTVGALVAMLTYTRATTLTAVDGLEIAQLDFQFDDAANPIGSLLAHTAAIEWAYVTSTLEGAGSAASEWTEFGPLMRLGPDAWSAARGRTLEQHITRLSDIRERALAGLRRVDDAWLSQPANLPWLRTPATHLWAWYHVMEDELNHRGQIRWLRSRLSPSRNHDD